MFILVLLDLNNLLQKTDLCQDNKMYWNKQRLSEQSSNEPQRYLKLKFKHDWTPLLILQQSPLHMQHNKMLRPA